jgi:hypothetical protein
VFLKFIVNYFIVLYMFYHFNRRPDNYLLMHLYLVMCKKNAAAFFNTNMYVLICIASIYLIYYYTNLAKVQTNNMNTKTVCCFVFLN